jgi:hypothetical protein
MCPADRRGIIPLGWTISTVLSDIRRLRDTGRELTVRPPSHPFFRPPWTLGLHALVVAALARLAR